MIGIYLRRDCTQVVKAVRRKKTLKVVATQILPSYFDCFKSENIEGMADMFRQINKAVGTKYEDLYLSLPNDLFIMDCAEYADPEEKWFEAHTGLNYEAYYTVCPVDFRARVHRVKSFVAIEKGYVDSLLMAAKVAEVSLLSVEAAGVSFLRALDRWKEEVCLLEVCKDRANFISYSPVAGLYSLPAPRLSLECWSDEAVAEAVLENDTIAKRTFRMVNLHVPIYVLAERKVDLKMPEALSNRKPALLCLPDGIVADRDIFVEFQIPIGGLMQDQAMDSMNLLPSYLKIESANVLPQEVRLESRLIQLQKKVKKTAKWAVFILSAVLAVEIAGILYYGSFTISEQLREEHDIAVQAMPETKKELEIIKKAGNEHQYPLEALRILVNERPEDISFASIEIGKLDKDWIRLAVKAQEAIQIRDYQSSLGANAAFKDIRISQITSDDKNNLKNALLAINRGKL